MPRTIKSRRPPALHNFAYGTCDSTHNLRYRPFWSLANKPFSLGGRKSKWLSGMNGIYLEILQSVETEKNERVVYIL